MDLDLDADALALKRQRNREAQQRSRDKKRRAHEAVLNVQLAELRLALATATRELHAKRSESAALRRKNDDVAERLASHDAAATDGPPPAVLSAQAPLPHGPTGEPPSGAPAPLAAASVPQGGERRAQAPCALFVNPDAAARRHRHTVIVSRRRMGCDGVGMEARIDAFRAAEAQRLGCDVHDILWLFESDSIPALTETSGMRTLVDTPVSVARAAMLGPIGQLKVALHEKIATRLEAHLAQLRRPRCPAASSSPSGGCPRDRRREQSAPRTNLPPSVLEAPPSAAVDDRDADPSASPLRFPPAQESSVSWGGPAATSGAPSFTHVGAVDPGDVSGVDWPPPRRADPEKSLADMMLGIYITDDRNHNAFRSPYALLCPSAVQCRTVAHAQTFARHVFGAMLQSILPDAHPVDVFKTARRFRETHQLNTSWRFNEDEALSMAAAYAAAVQGAHQVLQTACAHVSANAVLPRLPASADEVEARIAEHRRQAADAQLDHFALLYICSIDRPGYTVKKEQRLQFALASSSKTARDELSTLHCYRDLGLHTQQKLRLAALLADCRAAFEGLRREYAAALRALERLPADVDAMTRCFESLLAVAGAVVAPPPGAHPAPAPSAPTHTHRPGAGPQGHSAGGPSAKACCSTPGSSPVGAAPLYSSAWVPEDSDTSADSQTSPPLHWSQLVPGASGETTAAAGEVVHRLRAVLHKWQHRRMRMRGGVRDELTWKQQAVLFEGFHPHINPLRLCEMAAADLRCDRVFCRPAIAGLQG